MQNIHIHSLERVRPQMIPERQRNTTSELKLQDAHIQEKLKSTSLHPMLDIGLLDENRRNLAGFLCSNVGEFLELIGANLAEVPKQKDEGKLDSAC
jgi:hypothetical protein